MSNQISLEPMYRLHWKNKETGESGYSSPKLRSVAYMEAKEANEVLPEYMHWIESVEAQVVA